MKVAGCFVSLAVYFSHFEFRGGTRKKHFGLKLFSHCAELSQFLKSLTLINGEDRDETARPNNNLDMSDECGGFFSA